MLLVEDYVHQKLVEGIPPRDIAKAMDVTTAMVTQYKLARGYKPSLRVAKTVYYNEGVVLHPFSEESLKWELDNERK